MSLFSGRGLPGPTMPSMTLQSTQTIDICLDPKDGFSRIVELHTGRAVLIGRSSRSTTARRAAFDNVFFDCPVVSREHATLRADDRTNQVYITDVGSMHGTVVNGVALKAHTPCYLESGDVIKLGDRVTRGEDCHDCVTLTYRQSPPTRFMSHAERVHLATVASAKCSAAVPSGYSAPDSDYGSDSFDEEPTVGVLNYDMKKLPSKDANGQFGSQEKPIILDHPIKHLSANGLKALDHGMIIDLIDDDDSNGVQPSFTSRYPVAPPFMAPGSRIQSKKLGASVEPKESVMQMADEEYDDPKSNDSRESFDAAYPSSEFGSPSDLDAYSEAGSDYDESDEDEHPVQPPSTKAPSPELGDSYQVEAAESTTADADYRPQSPTFGTNTVDNHSPQSPKLSYDPVRGSQPAEAAYTYDAPFEGHFGRPGSRRGAFEPMQITASHPSDRSSFAPLLAHIRGGGEPDKDEWHWMGEGLEKTTPASSNLPASVVEHDNRRTLKNVMDIAGLVNAQDIPSGTNDQKAPAQVASNPSSASKRKADEMTAPEDTTSEVPSKIVKLPTGTCVKVCSCRRTQKAKKSFARRAAGVAHGVAKLATAATVGAAGTIAFLNSDYALSLIDWLQAAPA